MNCDRVDMEKATLGWDTTTGQRTLLITSMYGSLHMHATCIGVNGNSAVENVVPVIIRVAMVIC